MGYEAALRKAWDELEKPAPARVSSVKFLGDEYFPDPEKRVLESRATGLPAKDFSAIIILHYLASCRRGLPAVTGEWLDFRELSGVEGYEGAFRKRVIEPLIKKHGQDPSGLVKAGERLAAKKAQVGDISIVFEPLAGVPALVTLWRGDAEFGPEANVLFDRSIKGIFCTEDIVVLAGMIAGAL
jgi:hypothetical protein